MLARLGQYKTKQDQLRDAEGELKGRSEKRSRVDHYWAKLAEGERQPPNGPLQINTFKQFVEYLEQKRKLDGELAGVAKAVRQLAEKNEAVASEDKGGGTTATIVVGGTVYLDVNFEIQREMQEKDGQLKVNFAYEGGQLTDQSLSDVRSVLSKQVGAYIEQQFDLIEQKKQAIDRMFKGRGKKPTVPEMRNRKFELPVSWVEKEENINLGVQGAVFVNAEEPKKYIVRTIARVKTPMAGVNITLGGESARGTFGVEPNTQGMTAWNKDKEILTQIKDIAVRDVSAISVLSGGGRFLAEDEDPEGEVQTKAKTKGKAKTKEK